MRFRHVSTLAALALTLALAVPAAAAPPTTYTMNITRIGDLVNVQTPAGWECDRAGTFFATSETVLVNCVPASPSFATCLNVSESVTVTGLSGTATGVVSCASLLNAACSAATPPLTATCSASSSGSVPLTGSTWSCRLTVSLPPPSVTHSCSVTI